MRKLLLVLLLLAGGVVALGFYREWFSFGTTRDPEAGREGVQFEVDRKKITSDIEKAKQNVAGGGAQSGKKPDGQAP